MSKLIIDPVYYDKRTTLVRMPRAKAIKHPHTCIVCGGNNPDSGFVARWRHSSIGLFVKRLEKSMPTGGNPGLKIKAPCHRRCVKLTAILEIVQALPVLMVLWGLYFMEHDMIFAILAVSLLLVAYLFYKLFHKPLPLSVAYVGEDMVFHFANQDSAEQFARLNDAVIVDLGNLPDNWVESEG